MRAMYGNGVKLHSKFLWIDAAARTEEQGAAFIGGKDVFILPLTGSGSNVVKPRGTAQLTTAQRHVPSSEPRTSGKPSAVPLWLHFRCGRQKVHPLNLWSVFETTYPFQTLLLGSFPRWIQATNLTDLGNIQSGVSSQTSSVFFFPFHCSSFSCSVWTATLNQNSVHVCPCLLAFYLYFKVSWELFWIFFKHTWTFYTFTQLYPSHPKTWYLQRCDRCIVTNTIHSIWSIKFTCHT